MKIAILIPSMDHVHSRFAQSLANMVSATLRPNIVYNGKITRPHIQTFVQDMGGLEFKRINLALAALKWGSDYLLWCDSDHTFPEDALIRLTQLNLPIVGVNFLTREGQQPTVCGMDRSRLWTTAGKAEARLVEEVRAIGLGLCLVRAEVFGRLPKPWFASQVADDGAIIVGEDVHFCNLARSAGFKVHVDHGLSWECGHLATHNIQTREGANADHVLPAAGSHHRG